MERKMLQAFLREEKKKKFAKRLRREGKIPAVMYGKDVNQSIYVNEHDFISRFHKVTENTIINLKTNGKNHDVLIKDFQEDTLTGKIIHIDFYEIEKGKLLRTHVPIEFTGAAEGVKVGGIFETLMLEVEIECLPKDLPDKFTLDITNLNVGDALHISDIVAPEGVRILDPKEQVVCTIAHARVEKVEAEEEEEEEEAATEEAKAEETEREE